MGGYIGARVSIVSNDTYSRSQIDNKFAVKGKMPYYSLDSISTTGDLDLSVGNEFVLDASVSRTVTLSNAPTGRAMTVVMSISGASTVTWPSGIDWHGGTAPELGASWTVVVLNWDGANWRGVLGASA